jgi:hypothetical protein
MHKETSDKMREASQRLHEAMRKTHGKLAMTMVSTPQGDMPHPHAMMQAIVELKRELFAISHRNFIVASVVESFMEGMDLDTERTFYARVFEKLDVTIAGLVADSAEAERPKIITPPSKLELP